MTSPCVAQAQLKLPPASLCASAFPDCTAPKGSHTEINRSFTSNYHHSHQLFSTAQSSLYLQVLWPQPPPNQPYVIAVFWALFWRCLQCISFTGFSITWHYGKCCDQESHFNTMWNSSRQNFVSSGPNSAFPEWTPYVAAHLEVVSSPSSWEFQSFWCVFTDNSSTTSTGLAVKCFHLTA